MNEKLKSGLWILAVLGLAGQWILSKGLGLAFPPGLTALCSGLGILGAAFLISWAAELAELEIPPTLAFIVLALLTVLPEYAVDMYLAWQAGKDPHYAHFALANMTGANRLLIGLGWSSIVVVYWWKTRKREIVLEPAHKTDVCILLAATTYSFLLPWKKNLAWTDAIVFLLIFVVYVMLALRAEVVEPELKGPPALIGRWPRTWRRLCTVLFFLLAGYTIYIAAQPFAESLIASGRDLGVEEFLLVQWLAPLASEAPEFLVAILFVLRLKPGNSFHIILSSTINQWTLLVGMLPLAYSLSLGRLGALPMDARQTEEIFLTSAQSLCAVIILFNLRFSLREGLLLLVLFSTQLFLPWSAVRYAYAGLYLLLAAAVLLRPLLKGASKGFRTY